MSDLDAILTIEQGDEGPEKTLEAWAHLIRSGVVWKLQGFYQRGAIELIGAGWISPEGEILSELSSNH